MLWKCWVIFYREWLRYGEEYGWWSELSLTLGDGRVLIMYLLLKMQSSTISYCPHPSLLIFHETRKLDSLDSSNAVRWYRFLSNYYGKFDNDFCFRVMIFYGMNLNPLSYILPFVESQGWKWELLVRVWNVISISIFIETAANCETLEA